MKAALHRIDLGAQSVPLRFVRNPKARRYILRLLPCGAARVTIPRGGSMENAVEFARRNSAWLQRQLLRTSPKWAHGTELLFRGVPTPIHIREQEYGLTVSFAFLEFQIASIADLRPALEVRLRAIATDELEQRTIQIAAELGLLVRMVQVRDQRSRWGSCSSRGTISLNWRLVQTPDFVRDYIIVHELMHLKEMNHSARFWEHVANACPGYLGAEGWLRKNSRLLRY